MMPVWLKGLIRERYAHLRNHRALHFTFLPSFPGFYDEKKLEKMEFLDLNGSNVVLMFP